MTFIQFLGYFLIGAPFVALAGLATYIEGPLVALGIFAAAAIICGSIVGGVFLAAG